MAEDDTENPEDDGLHDKEHEADFVEFFQKEALSHIREPEALNTMLRVVDSRGWLSLTFVFVLFLAFFTWALFGSITTIVQGRGVLLLPNGVFSVRSELKGQVREVFVQPKQLIAVGDYVARIVNVAEEVKLERAREQLAVLDSELRRLRLKIGEEEEAKRDSLLKQLASQQKILRDTEEQAARLQKRLDDQKGYVEEGLFTQTEVEITIERLSNKVLLIEQTRSSIADLKEELSQEHRTAELRAKEVEYLDAVERLELLELNQEKSNVASPYGGKVLEVTTAIGHHVEPGDVIVWMEHEAEETTQPIVYGFVPLDRGKTIRRGHRVQVELTTVNPKEFGAVVGWVENVSQFAVSKSRMSAFLQNDAVQSYLSGDVEALLQVEIRLERDPDTPSGYRWTSGEGPPIQIETGAVGTLKIETEKVRPLYYLLPMSHLKRQAYELEQEWERVNVEP